MYIVDMVRAAGESGRKNRRALESNPNVASLPSQTTLTAFEHLAAILEICHYTESKMRKAKDAEGKGSPTSAVARHEY